jgi:hypothetical protein
MSNYAGVDWAAEKHDVRVCDELADVGEHNVRRRQEIRLR